MEIVEANILRFHPRDRLTQHMLSSMKELDNNASGPNVHESTF